MTLHGKIMNLIGRHDEWRTTSVNEQRAYRAGHRDARHAAAELAAEYEAGVGQLVEALKLLRNHSSVSAHQIEIIDAALLSHKGER